MTGVFSRLTPLLNGWRIAGWGSLLALLVLPALAMQVTDEVIWTASDFVFAAILFGFIGAVVELTLCLTRPWASRIGYLLAGFTAFLTLWSNAAVGIIGGDYDDNIVTVSFYFMVLGGLLVGALFSFRPAAMRWVALFLALGQFVAGIVALGVMPGRPIDWGVLTFFALLWLSAGWLFHRVASNGVSN